MPGQASSRPVRARGLKPKHRESANCRETSRPVRARGLKLPGHTMEVIGVPSRPVRARGLKQEALQETAEKSVAPCAGAWIETM